MKVRLFISEEYSTARQIESRFSCLEYLVVSFVDLKSDQSRLNLHFYEVYRYARVGVQLWRCWSAFYPYIRL